jgi:WD40 repeat protein
MMEIAGRLLLIYQQETGKLYVRHLPEATELRAASLNNKALSLMDLGQPERAMATWSAALTVDPLHIETTYNHGLILWRDGKLTDENLLANIHSAGLVHPGSWESLYLFGLVHLERGDISAAKKAMESIQYPDIKRREVQSALLLVNTPKTSAKFILHTAFDCTTHVTSVSLSADGYFALSGDDEKTVRLWDVSSGRCLNILEGHTNCVKSVCLSLDGHFALSGSDDHTVKLWDLEGGNCLRTFKGHKDRVTSVCFSANRRYALAGSWNKTLKLWDIESGRCLRTFEGHVSCVESVYLSNDGRSALSGSWDKTLKLWDVESGRCLRTFEGHTDIVKSVCLSADGRYALSGSNDRTLKLWDVETGRCLRTFEGHQFFVESICLSADGGYALSCSGDRSLRLWKVDSGRCLRTFVADKPGLSSVCLSADSRFALSGGWQALDLWKVDLDITTPVAPFLLSRVNAVHEALSSQEVYEQAVTQAQRSFETGDMIQAARQIRRARSQPGFERDARALNIWRQLYIRFPHKSLNEAWNIGTFNGHSDHVTSVSVSADGRYALSGSKDQTLKFWEIPNGNCLQTLPGHQSYVSSVCMSADGRYALSGSLDHTVKLWELSSGRCMRTFLDRYMSSVDAVALSVDGRYAVSGSRDRVVRLWEVESGRLLRTFQPNADAIKSVCISADDSYILADNGYETLKLWRVSNGRCIRSFKGIWLNCSTCLSGDGLYAMSASGALKLWEIATGKCLRTFDDPSGRFASISLSADGRFALSGSHNGDLKLWDVAIGQCLHIFEGHIGQVDSVCFSADGCFALSGSEDKTIKLWALDWDLEEQESADWDEGARHYLEIFLTQHTPYAGLLPLNRQPTEDEITLALTRCGKPVWTEAEFDTLLNSLGCAGYGWLKPEGVRKKLQELAAKRGRNG